MLRTRTKFGNAAQRPTMDEYQEFNNRQILGSWFSGMIDIPLLVFEIFYDGAMF